MGLVCSDASMVLLRWVGSDVGVVCSDRCIMGQVVAWVWIDCGQWVWIVEIGGFGSVEVGGFLGLDRCYVCGSMLWVWISAIVAVSCDCGCWWFLAIFCVSFPLGGYFLWLLFGNEFGCGGNC